MTGEPNILLDALLDEAGISRAGLASRINELGNSSGRTLRYDHTAVARWIAGQRPRGRVPDFICEILGQRLERVVRHEDAGLGRQESSAVPLPTFVERASARWRFDDKRPVDLQRAETSEATVVTNMAAVAPVWEWESPPEDLPASRGGRLRVGNSEIQMLIAARHRYEHMYRHAGGVATWDRIVRFLNTYTTPVVRGSYSGTTGRALLRAAGGLVAVAGICAYDADLQRSAQAYFHQALRFAKASGDRAFGGYVIALMVNQAVHLGDNRQAVAFAEAGLRGVGPHVTPALATDLHALQAKAFARMRDQRSAHLHMGHAEIAADRILRDEEPPETGYVQPGLVDTQLAAALLSLGDLSAARAYAEQAARIAAHPRGRVNRLVTVTTVAMARGDFERASDAATTMLELAQGMESARLRERFRTIRSLMASHRSSHALRDVVDRVDGHLAVPM